MDIVSHKNTVSDKGKESSHGSPDIRCILHHLISDSVHCCGSRRNMPSRIHQCGEFLHDFVISDLNRRYLDNLISLLIDPRGFQVKHHIIRHISAQSFSFVSLHHFYTLTLPRYLDRICQSFYNNNIILYKKECIYKQKKGAYLHEINQS